MRVLIAPDSYKGNLSAKRVAEAMREGALRVNGVSCDLLPIADGGEGTVEAMRAACGGSLRYVKVRGAQERTVKARYLLMPRHTAVIEVAGVVGLNMIRRKSRDIMRASSYGVGELIRDARERGARRIIVGLGGSATNDGGAGMLAALGARLLDGNGHDITPCPEGLLTLERIDLSPLAPLRRVEFIAACDVRNPLLGETGATAIFGPQKGATPENAPLLERALERFADALEAALRRSVRDQPGAGAAGGMGAALLGALGAAFKPGVEMTLEMAGFADKAANADLILTGEGRTDEQTAFGKAPAGVAGASGGKPVVIISGGVRGDLTKLYAAGVTAALSVCPAPMTLAQAKKGAYGYIADTAEQAVRMFAVGVGGDGDRAVMQ